MGQSLHTSLRKATPARSAPVVMQRRVAAVRGLNARSAQLDQRQLKSASNAQLARQPQEHCCHVLTSRCYAVQSQDTLGAQSKFAQKGQRSFAGHCPAAASALPAQH